MNVENFLRKTISESLFTKINLFEGKQVGELYHWTTFIATWSILNQNLFKNGHPVRDDVGTIAYEDWYGVSFTRDKQFHGWKNRHYPMESCIVVDGDKLAHNFKLFPYNDFFDGGKKPTKKISDEMETRTNKEIVNAKKYIKRIELYHNDGGASEKEQLDFLKWFPTYKPVLKGFNYENYSSIDEFKKELCLYIQNQGIECIIKS